MATFAQLAKGTLARKTVPLPFLLDEKGEAVTVDLVALNGSRQAEVHAYAREFSLAKKGTGADGDPNYELGFMVMTIALAALDPDVKDKSVTFFGGADEVLQASELAGDGIPYLFALQKAWQREISPGIPGDQNFQQFISMALEMGGSGDIDPFVRLRQDSQLSYVLFTTKLLSNLLRSKLPTGSDFGLSGQSWNVENEKQSNGATSPSENDK